MTDGQTDSQVGYRTLSESQLYSVGRLFLRVVPLFKSTWLKAVPLFKSTWLKAVPLFKSTWLKAVPLFKSPWLKAEISAVVFRY